MKSYHGITLVELLICISILSIITAIAVPNYGPFLAKQRANNEIRELQRLLLLARNNAIYSGSFVTVCPLPNGIECENKWHEELAVFYDINRNKQLDTQIGEYIIKHKNAIPTMDTLTFAIGRTALVYGPTGRLAIWGGNGTFKYCPINYESMARGLIVSVTGKSYLTYNIDQDTAEENRHYAHIHCT